MSNKFSIFTIILFAILFQFGIAWAVPGTISFQGRLTDGNMAVADGEYRMEFVLYDATENGSVLWSEVQNVTVKDGVYSVQLGSTVPLDVSYFDLGEVYLEVGVCPPGTGVSCDISEMERLAPRLPVTSNAFTFKAEEADIAANADLLDGHDSADFVMKNETAAVSTVMLADDAVTSVKIGAAAVDKRALADMSVTENKLDNDAVTTVKIADGAVTTAKLAGKSVTAENIVNDAVTTDKLADGAVTAEKIGVAAVNSQALASLSVTESKIASNAVTTSKLADGAVTAAKISGGAGSGIDADLLDGQHASDIIDAASDETRFPISTCGTVITIPGSYFLASNLTCTESGITISASNVSLDLNGFTISGDGYVGDRGIYINSNVSNVEIKNGTVRNFGDGIFTSYSNTSDIRIVGVRVIENTHIGISVTVPGCLVQDSIVENNRGIYAIFAGNYATIKNNIVHNNQGWGIFVSWHCLITGNSITANNQADDPDWGGLRIYGGNYVKGNLLTNNRSKNIYAYNVDNVIEENVLTRSTGYGIYFVGSGNFYANNRASGNSSGAFYNASSQTDGGGNFSY